MTDRYNKLDLFATDGRIGRTIYFLFSFILPVLFFWIIAAVAGQVSQLGEIGTMLAYGLIILALLAALTVLIRLTIQRNHDFNKTGWLALFIVIFPPIIVLYWLIPGTNGINSYGKPSTPLVNSLKWLVPLLFALLLAATAYVLSQIDLSMIPFIGQWLS